jgi:hypothetical protein
MSYVSGKMPDFKQAVFSIWFRVPQESIDKAHEQYVAAVNSSALTIPPFVGFIPVFSFGPRTTMPGTTLESQSGGSFTVTQYLFACALGWVQQGTNTLTNSFLVTVLDPTRDRDQECSFIGVDCTDAGNPRLCINFLAGNDRPSIDFRLGTGAENSDSNEWHCGLCPCFDLGGNPYCPGYTNTGSQILCDPLETVVAPIITQDQAPFLNSYAPMFRNCIPENNNPNDSIVQQIKADVWHHVLISVDFSHNLLVTGSDFNGISGSDPVMSSAPQLHVAFDDVDIRGTKLNDNLKFQNPVSRPSFFGEPNDLMTFGAQNIAQQESNNINVPFETGGGTIFSQPVTPPMPLPTYNLAVSKIPGGPVGAPCTANYTDQILAVNVGPIQVFTGETIDTASETMRRLFLTQNGKPAGVGLAEAHFRKKPDIKFNSARDWQKGHNHGTSGEFKPTGEIDEFLPKPNLFGAQEPEVLIKPKN